MSDEGAQSEELGKKRGVTDFRSKKDVFKTVQLCHNRWHDIKSYRKFLGCGETESLIAIDEGDPLSWSFYLGEYQRSTCCTEE